MLPLATASRTVRVPWTVTMLPYVATHVARYFLPAQNHNIFIPRTITILLLLPDFDSEGRRGGRQKSLYDSLLDGLFLLVLAEILRCVHAHWVTELPTHDFMRTEGACGAWRLDRALRVTLPISVPSK